MKKIKVLASVWQLDPEDVGGNRINYEWVTRLCEHVDLTVITAGARINETCGIEDNNKIKLIKIPPYLSFRKWDLFDRTVSPGYLEYFWRTKYRVKTILNKNDFDICHHFAPQNIRFASPFLDVKSHPTVFGPFHGGLPSPQIMKELHGKEKLLMKLRIVDQLRLRFDYTLRKHFKNATKLLLSADYVADILKPVGIPPSKFEVIPPPPVSLPNEVKSYKNHNKLKMIFVGRLVPTKGLEILIKSLRGLEHLNIELSVFGKGECEHYYKRLAEKLNVNDSISWKGFVPNNVIHQEMLNSDLFVFPSLREPFGIAIAEAMGIGLPVICVDYGGPGYIVTDNCGIKIKLSNLEKMTFDLHSAIKQYYFNRELLSIFGSNSLLRIRNELSWEASIDKILKLYNRLLNC